VTPRGRLACLAAAAALAGWGPARASAQPADAAPRIELYTIGTGSDLFSAWGHSLLCVAQPSGQTLCYDFGVPVVASAGEMVWGSLRGRALFGPVAVDLERVLAAFRAEERDVWRQALPLAPAEARALAGSLERAVAAGERYAYHPYHANCTTELRDRIDAATRGALGRGADRPDGGPLRAISEAGLTGRVVPLAVVALLVGAPADRATSGWDRMLVPAGLRDAVRERFGAEPERLHARGGIVLPTSPAVGRGALALLGVLVAALVALGRRRGARSGARARALVGLALGLVGLLVHASALVGVYPELGRNWALLLFLPTDVALGALRRPWLDRYVVARLAVAVALVAASAAGLVRQPIALVGCLAALPLAAVWRDLVARRAAPAAPPKGGGQSGET
jgi:hypothetical protein